MLECACYPSTWIRTWFIMFYYIHSDYMSRWFQFSSVAQLCLTLWDPMNCSTPDLPIHHLSNSWSSLKFTCMESVMPSNHFILSHPVLLLPSIFPSIRVFSNESVVHIRWPKYWSFSFGISPSSEYSGLISFRIGLSSNNKLLNRAVSNFQKKWNLISLSKFLRPRSLHRT